MLIRQIFLGFSVLTLTACGTVDSTDITSNSIDAEIFVDAEGNSTKINATLKTIGPKFGTDYIRLVNGDRLNATVDGAQTSLISDEALIHLSLDNNTYKGEIYQNRSGADVTVGLHRRNGDNAYAQVTLPAALNINSPDATETFGVDDSITVAWTPGDETDSVHIVFTLHCPVPNEHERTRFVETEYSPDTGVTTIPVIDIVQSGDLTRFHPQTGIICPTEIEVIRYSWGTHNFGTGSVRASQRARVIVNINT